MNDLDLCLEVISRSRHRCVTFDVEYLGNVRDRGFVPKEMAYGGQTRDLNTLSAQYLENYLS